MTVFRPDPKDLDVKFRPYHDWVLVFLDPNQDETRLLASGLTLLADYNPVRQATVIRVGPGKHATGTSKRVPVGVEPGERVAFFRWHFEHKTGKAQQEVMSQLMHPSMGLIRSVDILMVLPSDKHVEISTK